MPYPAKTGREAILTAALEQVAREGVAGLSVRALAGSLGLAPNALYRYFSDRADLQAALADASAGRLHQVLQRASKKRQGAEAIGSMARAYLRFAREQPRLYEAMMQPPSPSALEETPQCHQALWAFVVEQVAQVAKPDDAPQAAVALWALLHGVAGLNAAGVFGRGKPASGFEFGLKAWLAEAGRK